MIRPTLRKFLAGICVFVALCTSPVRAEFTLDEDSTAVRNELGVYELGDLGVGEVGYTSYWLCSENGVLHVPTKLHLVSERSDYANYFKVKRLPSQRVEIELIPAKDDTKSEVAEWFLGRLTNINGHPPCRALQIFYGFDNSEFLAVESIDNVTTTAELLKNLVEEKESDSE